VNSKNTTCTLYNVQASGNLFKVWHPDEFVFQIFLLRPFLDTCRALTLEHVIFQQVVFSLCQRCAEKLNSLVGGGDLFACLDVPATDHYGRLVHVETEGVGVATVVYQGHAGVDGRPDNLPAVCSLLS